MRILFIPREDGQQMFGGDVVQMNKTAEALRDLGVLVDIGPVEQAKQANYDVVHLWTGLHFPHMLEPQVAELASLRGTTLIALSTIWAPHHLVRWMDAARRWLFRRRPDAAQLSIDTDFGDDLNAIALRTLDFQIEGQPKVSPFAPHTFMAECREVLSGIDLILPNSWMELRAIYEYLGDFCAYAVVPNAVDARDFDGADPSELPDELRGRPYALMSARFDTRKQQDFAMLAIKDLDIPMVFVGAHTDVEIFERTRVLAQGRKAPVFSYPFMPHAQLRNLYAGALVHLLPSIFESPGLSSLEAALLDCAVVVGNLGFESEYFQEGAYYCDPCSAFSIRNAVAQAWIDYPDEVLRRKILAKRIRRDFTWHAAAEATLRAYRRNAIKATPKSASPTPIF